MPSPGCAAAESHQGLVTEAPGSQAQSSRAEGLRGVWPGWIDRLRLLHAVLVAGATEFTQNTQARLMGGPERDKMSL